MKEKIRLIGMAYRRGQWIEITRVSYSLFEMKGYIWITWYDWKMVKNSAFIPPVDCSGNDEIWNTVKLFPPDNEVFQIFDE